MSFTRSETEMSKSKLEKAGGCLVRAGGILGALSVAVVLSLFALCGYLHFGLSLTWLFGLSTLSFASCLVLGFVFPAYFAGLLFTSTVVCVVFQLDWDVTSKDDPWWIVSGLGALLGLILLIVAMTSGKAYQFATAGALVTQYLIYMMFVVKSWRDSKSGDTGSSGKLAE
jgi:hypothetical protein